MKKGLLLTMFILSMCYAQSQHTAAERCANFQKGMNLSNWLEAGWQPGWPTTTGYSKADIQLMKEAGINSLRLPVCFARIVDSLAPFHVDESHILFDRIDSVLQWTSELQMNLIIDNHHEWNLSNENWRNDQKRFAHLWGTLANRYKNTDPRFVTFELLNEPAILFALDSLNILFNTAIDSIRSYTTAHSVIVSPNIGSLGMAFINYQPLPDTNLIYTWHCYDPLNFTHQGFVWGNPTYPSGTPFPAVPVSFYESLLYDGINSVNHWIDTFKKPLFLGEFGVSEHADEASRCHWISFIGHELDSMHIPWFYWDWRWDFSMFRSHVVSADSVIPCFAQALHLYGDTLTSFSNLHKRDGVSEIYPNPISNGQLLHLKVQNANPESIGVLSIVDGMGRLMEKRSFASSALVFPVQLDKGFYFVEVYQSNGDRTVRKLVVE